MEISRTLPWKPALLGCIVILVIFLGAGRQIWSLGLAVILAGLAAILAPPVLRLPKLALIGLIGFALAPLTGFLPVSWAGGVPAWRTSLMFDWGIWISPTVSPDPGATLESWFLVVAMMLWLWVCLGQGYSRSGLRMTLSILALGGAALAGAAFLDAHSTPVPWWSRAGLTPGDVFGPLANRNHSSSLNAISAVLCVALALDAWRRRSRFWIVHALAFGVPTAAIFMNTSRGGLLMFLVGLAAWAMTATAGRGWLRKAMVILALFLVLGSVAFVSSGRLGGRLRELKGQGEVAVVESSLRLDLARQTLNIAGQQPLFGSGFGTFNQVFPQLSSLKLGDIRVFHPESDVLMLLFEGGILALLPCGLFLVWAGLASGPWRNQEESHRSRDRSGRRLRQAAAIGVGMALLHGIFDVPQHGTGYAMHTLLLLGLAVSPKKLGAVFGVWLSSCIRLAGVAAVGLGVLWAGIDLGKWQPDTSSSVLAIRREARQQAAEGSYRAALASMDRAIWLAPLDYRLYYTRAQLLLQLRQSPDRALLDFGRARALEPHYTRFCFEEGEFWLSYVPEMAMVPWRECLRRLPKESYEIQNYYQQMLSRLGLHPQLRESLWALAETPQMQMIYLAHVPERDRWPEALRRFLETHPDLDRLDPALLRRLFRLWHDMGDREALALFLTDNPRLQPYGWRTLAYEEARVGHYQEAVMVAAKFLKRPDKPTWTGTSDLARLERALVLNPNDLKAAVDLYYAQYKSGDLKRARLTAETLVALPAAPPFMKLELAMLYAEMKDPRRGWEMMEQAIQVLPEI